jgi:hypothetical protein
MAKLDHVLFVQTGEVALRFAIEPLSEVAELSQVIDRLSKVADTNHCNGCD